MNQYLAAMYNTHGAGDAAQEERVKVASLELFCKAAAAEGINLTDLPQNERENLYTEFINKLAAEGEEGGSSKCEKCGKDPCECKKEESKGEGDKEAAAKAEYEAGQETLQKRAEADFLGRQMAHAFWDEFNSIQKTAAEEEEKKDKDEENGDKDKKKDEEKKDEKKDEGNGNGGGGGLPPQLAAAMAAKEGSAPFGTAFDKQAFARAIAIAESSPNIDTGEATKKLAAVVELGGPGESEKISHTKGDYEFAKNVRGLEYLEAAGYPVAWEEVFKG